MADIFISYARADRAKIEKLASALEEERYSVWWDRHIQSGSEFSADIERELNDAKAVITCWSEEGSKSRWVKDEANIAAETGKLFAIRLDESPPPIGFRQYHTLNFSDWTGSEATAAFGDLLQALKTRIPDAALTQQGTIPKSVKSTGHASYSHPILAAKDWKMWAGATVVVIALVIFGWVGFRELNNAPQNETMSQSRVQKSVAVLPFTNLSSNAENEIFAIGLTEDILNSLDRLPELRVSARTSSFYFKDKDLPVQDIAEQLNVAYVVEGSVRRAGERLRVTAELSRASDGFRLWSESYDRPAKDVFDVQEDIAKNIAVALDIYLDDEKRADMFAYGTRDIGAFEAFLTGRSIYDRAHQLNSTEDHWKANAYFAEAVRLDPKFSTAYSYHHDAYAHFLMQDYPSLDEDLTSAEALEIIRDDFAQTLKTLPDRRSAMAMQITAALFTDSWRRVPDFVQKLDADVKSGVREVRSPAWSDTLLIAVGRADLVLNRTKRELERNPLDPVLFTTANNAALAVGDYDLALYYARRGLEIAPGHMLLQRGAAIASALRGDLETAVRQFEGASGDEFSNGLAAAFSGNHQRGREIALQLAEKNTRDAMPIIIFAEIGDTAEVTRLTRIIDESPLGALSFMRLIQFAGGFAPFDMDAAPNFRARLLEAGGDPESLKPWKPLSTSPQIE